MTRCMVRAMDDTAQFHNIADRAREYLAAKGKAHPKPTKIVLNTFKGNMRRLADADVVVVQGIVVKDRYGHVSRRG